jgi:hypothetical protein
MERLAVAMFPDRAKAEPVCKRLAEAGMKPEIHKNELLLEKLWFVHKSHPVRIEVPCEQFEPAGHMLQDWDAHGALPDAIHCPECKSLRVQYPQFAHKSVIPNMIVGLMATFGGEKEYYCEDCHYTWPKEGTKMPKARPNSAPYYFIEGVEQSQIKQQPPASRQKA